MDAADRVNALYYDECDFSTFLIHLAKIIPEISFYETICCYSPESPGKMNRPNTALVQTIFGPDRVRTWMKEDQETAFHKIREINKVFLRLAYLRSFIKGDKIYFPDVSEDRFYKFSELIQSLCLDKELLFFTTVSIIFESLGRTRSIRDLMDQKLGTVNSNIDHETYWRRFLQNYEGIDSFNQALPSLKLLNERKELYKNQVMTNSFNLSAFVRGESVPYSFYELAYSSGDYRHRIIVLFLTFLSFRYNNNFQAVGYTDPTHDQFSTAVRSILKAKPLAEPETDILLLKECCLRVYKEYLEDHAVHSGVPVDLLPISSNEKYTLFRIFALSRSSNVLDWKKLCYVWQRMLKPTKDILVRYMTVTGFGEEPAIYVYYAPALIANIMTVAKTIKEFSQDTEDFHRDGWTVGLFYGLYKLAGIYENIGKNELPTLKQEKNPHGAGTYFYNAADDAKNILDDVHYHQTAMKQLMVVTPSNEELM